MNDTDLLEDIRARFDADADTLDAATTRRVAAGVHRPRMGLPPAALAAGASSLMVALAVTASAVHTNRSGGAGSTPPRTTASVSPASTSTYRVVQRVQLRGRGHHVPNLIGFQPMSDPNASLTAFLGVTDVARNGDELRISIRPDGRTVVMQLLRYSSSGVPTTIRSRTAPVSGFQDPAHPTLLDLGKVFGILNL